MENLEHIKEKINKFLDEFKSNKIKTPAEAMNRFKELFKNEYFEIDETENKPYFKSHSQNIYIKNGYGIGISKVWGPMDFMGGGIVSHKGTDVYIFSAIADEYITLFDESERNVKLENSEKLYNIDLSIEKLKELRNDIVFKTLPNEVKNKDELIKERYRNLKISAEVNHENDITDDLISYYGGLDVTINSTEYYLYNSLLEHINDENFMKKVIPLFVTDFPDYLNNEIDTCEHALYMIRHKEDFYKWANLSETIDTLKLEIYKLEIKLNSHLKKQSDLQVKLNDISDEYKELQNKKYNILELITQKKKSNTIKIKKIQRKMENLMYELATVNIEIEEFNESNYNLNNDFETTQNKMKDLSTKLERPFKDFTLNLDFEDETYINGNYHLNVSLDRLVNKESEYTKKLKELQKIKSYAMDKNIDLKKENEIEYLYN